MEVELLLMGDNFKMGVNCVGVTTAPSSVMPKHAPAPAVVSLGLENVVENAQVNSLLDQDFVTFTKIVCSRFDLCTKQKAQ